MMNNMTEGILLYENGSVRFDGEYEVLEDGTEKYIKGSLYREDGTLWMQGRFQRGGLRSGKQYYPNGQLMFSGEYNDRERGSYYGPPYPVRGTLYDEEGKVLYDGRIPKTSSGSLGYPYIRLPDGSLRSVEGIR